MRIKHLDLTHFGKFHQRQIDLAPGINVIYGRNEAGKSTVHGFLECMFFGAERLRGRGAGKDTYSRFLPWEGNGAYEGSLSLERGEKSYRILRDFQKDAAYFQLIDEDTGTILMDGEGDISGLIEGLTRDKYRNTISVGQLALEMDGSFPAGMQNYMANLSMSAREEVDIDKALAYLKKKKSEGKARLAAAAAGQDLEQEEKLRKAVEGEDSLLQELARHRQEQDRIDRQIQELKKEHDRLVLEDQKSRADAIRLIQENNDIATQYRERKAALARIVASKTQGSQQEVRKALSRYQQQGERIADLKYRQAEIRGSLGGTGVKALALALPLLAVALLVWLLGGNIGIPAGGRQILALACCLLAGAAFLAVMIAGLRRRRQAGELEEEILEREAAQRDLLTGCGVSSVEELRQGAAALAAGSQEENRLRTEMRQLRSRYDALQEPLRPYIKKYGESLSLESDAGDAIRQRIDSLQERADELKQTCSQLEWQLEEIGRQRGQLESLQERLQKKKADRKEAEEELEAIDLSIRTIQEITSKIHEGFGADLSEEVSRLFALISDGSHARILLDDKFQILVDDGHRPVRIGQMSAGTGDQIYFSIRLAVARAFFRESMPLILDDSFALYDDQRLERTLLWLGQRSGFSQIILFTCHHREASILERAGIPFTYHQLD